MNMESLLTHRNDYMLRIEEDMPWMNKTGVTLSRILGDPTTCTDVIYTADNRLLTDKTSFVTASWESLAHVGESKFT